MNSSKFLILAICVAGAAYFPALTNGFVMDDGGVVAQNTDLDRWPPTWLVGHDYFQYSREMSYRPMVTLTHVLDRHWGALGAHLFNLILHVAVGFSLFLLGKKFLSVNAAVWGTLIYLVHPAYSEAVYVVTFREDMLCALFILRSLMAASAGRHLMAGLFFTAALFSKETAAMTPVLMTVLVVGLPPFRTLGRSLPMFILIDGVYAFIRFVLMAGPGFPAPDRGSWLGEQGAVFTEYVQLLSYPATLSIDYKIPVNPEWMQILPGLLLAAVFLFHTGLHCFKKSPAAVFGLWFFVFMLPVIGIIPITNIAAERYLYIPCLIPALGVGVLLDKLQAVAARRGLTSIGFAALVILLAVGPLGIRTHARGSDFLDSRSLYLKEMEINPLSKSSAWILGRMELNAGRYDEARTWLRRAHEINPYFHPIFIDLGRVEQAVGHREAAAFWFDAAYAAAPDDPEAILCLAEMKRLSGDTESAEGLYRKAAQLTPYPSGLTQKFLDFHRSIRRHYGAGD